MAYQINKTDGTILATVADGQIDTLSSDITLIGKNYSGFGEALNENLVKILENFANTTAPVHPIRGQIWFDSSESKLKVYNGSAFVPVSSATISNTQPSTLGVGDLWFNDVDKQLYFYDGTNTILLGPDYSTSQGLSGLKVANILDTLNQNRVITYLYNNGILLGIFSKDAFTPKTPIEGFSGSIIPGFNAGTLSGMKFNVTVTNSEQLGNQPASTYVRNDTSNIINGQLILTSNLGLIVGDASQAQLFVSNGDVIMANIASDKKMTFNVRRGVVSENAIEINSSDRTIKLYDGITSSEVITGGNLTVRGNLTVEGDTTTVQTAVVTVEDKNIVLASVDNPTDALADGGGIILKGDSDHEFLWSDSQDSWNSTEHINLASGKAFKINNVTVIDGTSLGPTITSIPGVTSFGPQTVINVGDNPSSPVMRLEDTRISTLSSNLDLELAPDGTGNVALIGSPKITGLADPTDAQDAATKEYTDYTIQTRSLVLSMDISDGISNTGIASWLTQIAPPAEYRNGTLARILCTIISNSASTIDLNPNVVPNITTAEVLTPSSSTVNAVTNFSFTSVTIPGPSSALTRIVKTYRLESGAWTFIF